MAVESVQRFGQSGQTDYEEFVAAPPVAQAAHKKGGAGIVAGDEARPSDRRRVSVHWLTSTDDS